VSVVANVAINVDATAAERALKNLGGATDALQRKFDAFPSKLGSALQGLGGKIQGFGQRLTGLGSVMAGIGASAAVGGFIKAGVEAERTAKTIKALADQHGETARLTDFASKTAAQFGIGQTQAAKAVADLYGRLRPMGVSLSDIQKTFTGVNKAAALMNLTAADTDGVMLQLSQALGSGVLQGDEFRSVMERLPAIGQAIATTMGVPVSQLKQLSSEGKITTDVVLAAMEELNKIQPPPPDAFKLFRAAMADLNTTIGQQLMPVFTPLVQKLGELIAKFKELEVGTTIAQALAPLGQVLLTLLNTFISLPAPVQGLIVQVGALVGAFALVAAPLGFIITGIGSFVSAVGALVSGLAGLKILATIAGWLGAIGPVIGAVVGALKTLGAIVAAVFSGPVGWVALAVAAGAAIYAFRDQIGQAFNAIGTFVKGAAEDLYNFFIKPVTESLGRVLQFVNESFIRPVVQAFGNLPNAIGNAFRAVHNAITNPIRQAYNFVVGIVQNIINAVNQAIRAIASIDGGGGGTKPQVKKAAQGAYWSGGFQAFAKGGVVTKPTMGLIGEGGEAEYIIPQSKAAGFAANYLSGARGAAAIPSGGGGGGGTPTISIQTGPVTQMNGTNYVTTQDMRRAVQSGVEQTLKLISGDASIRSSVGIR
jgi:tape measure domain-containing protein